MSSFSTTLSNWYKDNKRELPWRDTKNPYFIWLSEIILQQTRVAQGLPYYQAFIEAFPEVQNLANADENQVLRLWQGLGYYSRARNLHFSAKYISKELNGEFPSTFDEIKKLKGIGDYTAAAIASFAFGEKVAVLDGNVFRVMARVFGIEEDISSSSAKKIFYSALDQVIPNSKSDIFNQSIMEFGALQCVPKNPGCENCPLNNTCVAYINNKIDVLPVKLKKLKKRDRYLNYIVYQLGDKYAFEKREAKDIWTGLYQFPLIESDQLLEEKALYSSIDQTIVSKMISFEPNPKHLLSHQNLYSQMTLVELQEAKDLEFFSIEEVKSLPKPKLIENFLLKYIYKKH
jgi:A/G-specific adenine glycosylase